MSSQQQSCISMSTLDKMKYMAQDQVQGSMLVNDTTCLGGLVMVLSNNDGNIVKAALEVLQMLARFSNHHQRLQNFIGLKYQLATLISSYNDYIAELAGQVYEVLWSKEQNDPNHASGCGGDGQRTQTCNESKTARKIKAKNVILQVRGMVSKECVELCRGELMKVKGVISITFDPKEKQCKLRVRAELPVEKLTRAIANTFTMKATQVIYDDHGEKMMQSFDGSSGDMPDMPDYPNMESPAKGPADMAQPGLKSENDNWNFIKNIGSFLSNSFYW